MFKSLTYTEEEQNAMIQNGMEIRHFQNVLLKRQNRHSSLLCTSSIVEAEEEIVELKAQIAGLFSKTEHFGKRKFDFKQLQWWIEGKLKIIWRKFSY